MLKHILIFILCALVTLDVQAGDAAIASAQPLATKVGINVLKQGGNAFDAAVAISATLAVVEPFHSGLGGGGFWLIHDAKTNRNYFIDGREAAPLAASKDMFFRRDENGKWVLKPKLAFNGPLASAIPGEPAALAYIAKHFSRFGLKRNLEPAIKLAENGFAVNRIYSEAAKGRVSVMRRYPATKRIFLRDGKAPAIGTIIKQPELANTLRIFSEGGHNAFYRGRLAKTLVDAVRKAGGIWQMRDLARYHVKTRIPLEANFMGYTIVTAPPPSSGGVALLTMLNALEPLAVLHRPEDMRKHMDIEAMRRAYYDRARFLGDPDFVDVPLDTLLSKTHTRDWTRGLLRYLATPSALLNDEHLKPQKTQHNTTHFSVVDKEGNWVAATLSVNFWFGSGFVVPKTGILLNNHMADFTIGAGHGTRVWGLVSKSCNMIQPGKRPVSSMTPTFIYNRDRLAVFGTPGGGRIPTMMLLSLLDFVAGGDARSMVSVARYHHQYLPDVVQYQTYEIPFRERFLLNVLGHRTKRVTLYIYGDMQAITREHDKTVAASDPRKLGLAKTI